MDTQALHRNEITLELEGDEIATEVKSPKELLKINNQ